MKLKSFEQRLEFFKITQTDEAFGQVRLHDSWIKSLNH